MHSQLFFLHLQLFQVSHIILLIFDCFCSLCCTTNPDFLLISFVLSSVEHQNTLLYYYIDILNIFLIYFKTLKLIIISILRKHNKKNNTSDKIQIILNKFLSCHIIIRREISLIYSHKINLSDKIIH